MDDQGNSPYLRFLKARLENNKELFREAHRRYLFADMGSEEERLALHKCKSIKRRIKDIKEEIENHTGREGNDD